MPPQPAPPRFSELSDKNFDQFSEFITRELGIKMPPEKKAMLQSRLQKRIRQLGLESVNAYQEYIFHLPESSPEWIEFINLVTTNKTDFFREPAHFDYLVKTALPALAPAGDLPWKIKLWCAGCSSGEEPHTLAMLLSQYRETHPHFDFSILGTDISTRVLDLAKQAIYDESRVEPVPVDLRHRYLMRSKDRQNTLVRIVPELREKIRFARLNFMHEDYGLREHFDIVFFRNVMIYFDKATQQQVLSKICRNIRKGGYLFAGHSESLVGFNLPVKTVHTSVFQKIS